MATPSDVCAPRTAAGCPFSVSEFALGVGTYFAYLLIVRQIAALFRALPKRSKPAAGTTPNCSLEAFIDLQLARPVSGPVDSWALARSAATTQGVIPRAGALAKRHKTS